MTMRLVDTCNPSMPAFFTITLPQVLHGRVLTTTAQPFIFSRAYLSDRFGLVNDREGVVEKTGQTGGWLAIKITMSFLTTRWPTHTSQHGSV
jgi:hypothetical protein